MKIQAPRLSCNSTHILMALWLYLTACPAFGITAYTRETVIEVSAGRYHTLMLKADGSVWATGHNNSGQLGDGTNLDSLVPKWIMNDTI